MSKNIAYSLSKVAERKKESVGIIEAKNGRTLTFGELEQKSDQYAWHLSTHGVKAGDRVMLMVKPSAEFICITFALFKLGAPVILIDPGMGYKNLLTCISGVVPKVFIGIPQAHIFMSLFRGTFATVKQKFCVGNSNGIIGPDLRKTIDPENNAKYPICVPEKNDLAAIIFTTGSTGPPKGVRYEHSIFAAQLEHIKSYYTISDNDVDQPAFPLFALFSAAIGACSIIPDMDATKPAKVNPDAFIQSILKYNVTYSFGSPALWNVVSNYCIKENIKLRSLRKILMAGAPVSGELIEQVYRIIPDDSEIHIPYGATESLPIVSIEGSEVVRETWSMTKKGMGTCVGRPLPGIEIGIISITEGVINHITQEMLLDSGEIGEIIVSGNVITQSYDNNRKETELAKIYHEGKLFHRMGDTGYLDTSGRLWFCGRKSHRVQTDNGVKYTIPCEAIINQHPDVFRSALVGITAKGKKKMPVMVIELNKSCKKNKNVLRKEIMDIAHQSQLTRDIGSYLFHPDFPVDIRHNAKIFREKLCVWAEQKMGSK